MLKRLLFSLITTSLLVSCSNEQTDKINDITSNHKKETTPINTSDAVITLKDTTYTKEALDFYILMNKVNIEWNRHEDEKTLTGEKRLDKLAYWDEQLQQYENLNVNLQSFIELHAMALLAEEKGYYIPEQELEQQLADYQHKIEVVPVIQQLINEYGQEEYDKNIKEYIRLNRLQEKVIKDLQKTIKSETPDASEQEQNFLLQERYEELYMDQVKSLELTIHVN